jgi:predicted PurR-regulated permease PerM
MHYDIISAFIKSIRGSNPDAALYWLARMIEGGEKPEFIARRLIISAAEDIGLANPNALLLAFCCGVLVIVPYVGAVVGAGISYIMLLVSMIGSGVAFDILTLTLTFGGIFIATKLIDDFIMQPFIYSKSVKAHPLEIFLVILIAGEVGGILGMIIAIPLYTLIRIILKEFYSNSRFVQNFIKGI